MRMRDLSQRSGSQEVVRPTDIAQLKMKDALHSLQLIETFVIEFFFDTDWYFYPCKFFRKASCPDT
jgi:hypothetical protein